MSGGLDRAPDTLACPAAPGHPPDFALDDSAGRGKEPFAAAEATGRARTEFTSVSARGFRGARRKRPSCSIDDNRAPRSTRRGWRPLLRGLKRRSAAWFLVS